MDASSMAVAAHTNKPAKGGKKSSVKDATVKPGSEWTLGLKRIYDSVLDEPLPDAFKDLLAKLDDQTP
jgi:hypothetical protein